MKARGFTLIEVLVATAIAALVLASLTQTFSLGLRTISRSRHALSASLIAESTLATLGRSVPLVAGEQVGRVGRYRVRLRMAPMTARAAPGIAAPGTELVAWRVRVAVAWQGAGAARVVRLDTIRLAAAP